VARAVLASTLTTIAVFFPVVYVPGVAGAFFRDQALTVTFALLVSAAAALLLQPTLAALLLNMPAVRPSPVFRAFHAGLARVYQAYHVVLIRALARPRASMGVLVAIVALGLFVGTQLDRSFMPARSAGDTRLDLELAAGMPLEETLAFTQALASSIADEPGVRAVFSQVGRTERTLAAMQEYVASNTARIRILLEPGRDTHDLGEEIRNRIGERLAETPGVRATFREEGIGLAELLATGEAPFTMGVVSDDALLAAEAAERIAVHIADIPGLQSLKVDRVVGAPTLVAELDRDRILRNGLDPDALARELRHRVAGVEATTFNEVEQRIDIAVRLPRATRLDLGSALDTPVSLASGETVPLRSFIRVREERPVRELVRRDQRRMVSITGDVEGRGADAVWEEAVARAGELDLPGDVMLVAGGEQAEMERSFRDLGWAMVLAIALVYMILAGQFESFLDPLLIAAVLPVGVAGAAVAIGLTGHTLNVLSLIGLLALLGIAVNDAIVKIDTIRRLRDEGMEAFAAILEASRLRFRPIVMTSVTTVLAMLPMAIGLGSGEQLQRPLAVTIIGGLTLTTFLTLVTTPVLYLLAHRIRPIDALPIADAPTGPLVSGHDPEPPGREKETSA
jgi:HAE1 family hydrophobic/amphiphilic exporter-1